jgi:hypothetical protein
VLPPPKGPADSLELVDELAEEQPERAESSLLLEWEALEAEAQFAHVLHGGRAVTPEAGPHAGSGADDEEFLGLPGLLTPEQTAALLAQRDGALRKRASRSKQPPQPDLFGPETLDPAARSAMVDDIAAQRGIANGGGGWRAAAELRREVNRLVAVLAARTGTPHGALHAKLRAAVPGPASASASADLLEARREHLMAMM